MTVKGSVLAVLTPEWQSIREITERCPELALSTVQEKLRILRDVDGVAESDYVGMGRRLKRWRRKSA